MSGIMSLLSEIKTILVQTVTESSDSGLLNPKKYMNFSLLGQLVITLCCCLTSFSLKHFSNVGFQLFITGFANLFFAFGAFWVCTVLVYHILIYIYIYMYI
jgi:hypothetical protein